MAVRTNVPVRLGPLATIPVTVESSLEAEPHLSNVCTDGHPEQPSKVAQTLACKVCGKTGPFDKGREEGGRLVVLTEADLVGTATPSDVKDAMVLTAHPRADVEQRTLISAKPYVLRPGKGDLGGQGYALLRHLVASDPDTAFATIFAPKGKPSMFVFGVHEGVVTMTPLAWPEDVRALPAVPDVEPSAELLALATAHVDLIRQAFDPAAYRDTQRVAREELVQSRLGTAPVVVDGAPAPSSGGTVTSLLDALQRSLDEAAPKPRRPRKSRAKVSA